MTTDAIDQPSPSSTPVSTQSRERTWEDVHAEVRYSIVSIESAFPFPFGITSPKTSFGTGFVVDSEVGIILSNLHIMGVCPTTHKATFDTNEFVYLQPLHYDPIHDFAFFRYDPAALKHTKPKSIKLFPEGARPGVPFQMIGNASGEKLTVCSGTLSQVNRNSPERSDDQDVNTFYFQASTTSAGGSSGSPVLDINGNAIALNAAKNLQNGSSFFLPLDRIVYSLEYIRRGEQVPRGTVQTVFVFETYDEMQRLGLPEKEADSSRLANPKSEGMLVVETVLRSGPADRALETGDIVVSLSGTLICDFVGLESALDANVNGTVDFVVSRKGELVPVTVNVQDMYDVTPTQLLDIETATLHNMSLLLAHKHLSPVTGVYVADHVDMFLPTVDLETYRLIISANGTPTPDLTALLGVFRTVPVGQPMILKIASLRNIDNYVLTTASLMKNISPLRLLTRSAESGFWSIEHVELAHDTAGGDASKADLLLPSSDILPSALASNHSNLGKAWKSVVRVTSTTPFCIDNNSGGTKVDTGFVIDKTRGIVVCSAEAFRGSAANISLIIRNTLQIAATIVYVHPLYPLVFLKYDPSDLGSGWSDLVSDLPVDNDYWSGERRLTLGQELTVLNCNMQMQPHVFNTQVLDLSIYRGVFSCKEHGNTEHFNINFINVVQRGDMQNSFSGLFCDSDGNVIGLWARIPRCYRNHCTAVFTGIDLAHIGRLVEKMRSSNEYPDIVRTLNARFIRIPLINARGYGLSDEWIVKISSVAECENSLFKVSYKDILSAADASGIEVGDIILSVDGEVVRRVDNVAIIYEKPTVDLVVLRQGKEVAITANTVSPHETNTRRYLKWAGLYIQEPHVTTYRTSTKIYSTAYNSYYEFGSPGQLAPVPGGGFITELNDEKVETIDDLVRILRKLKVDNSEFNAAVAAGNLGRQVTMVPGCDVKVKLINCDGEVFIRRFRTDDHYKPAWQMVRGSGIDAKWTWEYI